MIEQAVRQEDGRMNRAAAKPAEVEHQRPDALAFELLCQLAELMGRACGDLGDSQEPDRIDAVDPYVPASGGPLPDAHNRGAREGAAG